MRKKINYLLLFTAFLFVFSQSFGQGFRVKMMSGEREDGGFAYNFFIGDDAEDFATSINGFGSGFLFDVLTGRESWDIVNIGTKHVNLSLGAGFAINKYRFQNNLVLDKNDDGMVTWMVDPDETHDYVNTFFGYGKSKLVTASFYFPAYLNFNFGGFKLSVGPFIDLYVYGKHKRKYLIGDDKEKVLIEPKDFKDFNLNKTKYGVSAAITHKATGVGISGTYYLTPFFEEEMGPDLTEARISLTFKPEKMFGVK